ncbi:MAG: benzoyl-CoA reductase [Planctomycetaceae bacterium]|nr:benzoyl-CoA reductase [Planctomycetaceae bacterium]
MKYYAGIDAGSTYVKTAVINNGSVLGSRVARSGVVCAETAGRLLDDLLSDLGLHRADLASVMATGYGRRTILFADDTVSEIAAHAGGTRMTAPEGVRVKTIIDIGGQDSKVIVLDDDGEVKNFVMNDKCAAGTGRFMEVLAETLEASIDELGELARRSTNPCQINSLCVVFAQSEVISLLARGKDRADIVAGLHNSLAARVGRMARRDGLQRDVLMTGGGALNSGLQAAFEEELMTDVHVARHAQFNGAIGAAVLAQKRTG